jgi:hypothetical protein
VNRGYITSDDEQLDPNSVLSVLACLKENTIDEELVEDLVNLLETNEHYDLAGQMARICLEISPSNLNMIQAIKRLGRPDNVQLGSKLRNLWMTPQKYLCNDNLIVREILNGKYVEPNHDRTFNEADRHSVDLEGILYHLDHIPSYPDTMIIVPVNAEYYVHRKFYVEQFQIYNLQIKFACSNNIDVSLSVNTEVGDNRLSYKLSGSQVQYNFNTLNQNLVEIGLKGHNKSNQIGQLRIMEISLTRRGFNFTTIDRNLKYRSLSPTLPIIANLYITSTDTMEGINATLDSLVYQVDLVNIYLNNLSREQLHEIDILLHNTKYRIKQGREGRLGSWYMSMDVMGYQMMVEAGIVYDDNYVGLILSKLQQYGNKVIVGLNGIQLQSDYQDWTKSKRTVSNIMIANQDIKCHILGVNTMGFLTGVAGNIFEMPTLLKSLTPPPPSPPTTESFPPTITESSPPPTDHQTVKDNEMLLLFAIMAQKSKVGMICIERIDKMIKYHSRDESKMVDEIGSRGEQIIKSLNEWKYF